MPQTKTSLRQPLLAILLLGLAGCAAVPPEEPAEIPAAAVVAPDAETAWRLERDGDLNAAANIYLAVAETLDREGRVRMQLHAADLLLRAAELERVETLLFDIDPPRDNAELTLRHDLLFVRISLARELPKRAAIQLPPSLDPALPEALRREALQLRATVLERIGDTLGSAEARGDLDTMLAGAERHANQMQLLRSLGRIDAETLRTAGVAETLAGWIELARLAGGPPLAEDELRLLLDEWRAMRPDHPVLDIILEWLVAQYAAAPPPERVALLLPRSGPFATAAGAVMEGFLAAAYASHEPAAIRLYDSSGSVWNAYQRAVDDGAEFVVGPLSKANVADLARRATLPVPVLALNRAGVDATPAAGFYQFALSPEAEAREVAEQAWTEGHRQVTVLYPANDLGRRTATAFGGHWESLGGLVLDLRSYNPAEHDFSDPIREMLELTASEGRFSRLRRLLRRDLEYEPRRRLDIDAVMLVAFPRQARQIRPQLDFHRAADLPLFATSHAYAPGSKAEQNLDLEGLLVCDMPWSFPATRGGAALAPLIDTAGVASANGALGRLFALGADAYAVIPYLQRLQADPEARMDGNTGILSLDSAGLVQRQLLCARIVDGKPRMVGYTPDAAPLPAKPEAIEVAPEPEAETGPVVDDPGVQ